MFSLANHNRSPEAFEVVSVEIPPLGTFANAIPKPEHYDDIVRYLSWKVLRGTRPSVYYNDLVDGELVIRKDVAKQTLMGSTSVFREVHAADKDRETSLKRIYVGDRGTGTMVDPVAGPIAPRKFSVYDARTRAIHEIPLEDFPEGGTDDQAYEMADLELSASRTETGLMIAKHNVYIQLALATKMMPPPISSFK